MPGGRFDVDDLASMHLRLAGGASGLACVQLLHEHDPDMVIVVLTGFASIATAVEAIKLGARHYLAKPANPDDIEAAFARAQGDAGVELTERTTSIKTLEWERIHETLADTGFNISETARRLGLHRRTLTRKLKEIKVARAIEQQTARLPSDTFLWMAGGSIAASLTLKLMGRDKDALFVGQWAPTLLILGLYNKLVKTLGTR